jgi:hypothetical protein
MLVLLNHFQANVGGPKTQLAIWDRPYTTSLVGMIWNQGVCGLVVGFA